MQTKEQSKQELTGRRVLMYLLAFFSVVIGMNVVLAKLAIDTLPGTEVDSAYKASLAYNTVIKSAHAQDARGWRADASVQRDSAGRAFVKIEMRDRAGQPLAGLAITAQLVRPTDKRADREVTLREPQAGLYRGEADDVAPGQWDLVIEAEGGGQHFASKNRLILK